MQSIICKQFGDLEFLEVGNTTLKELGPHDVCIATYAVGFNPVDYKIRKGYFGGQVPLILGSDCSGIVEACGNRVTRFQVGDPVMCMPFGAGSSGAYAEKVIAREELVCPIPIGMSFTTAAAFPLAALTAYRAYIAIKNYDSPVFIAGVAGGVGAILASMFDPHNIYTVARDEPSALFMTEELKIPKNNIALYAGKPHQVLAQEILALHKGQLFKAVFDLVGDEAKNLCLELCDYGGDFVTIVPEAKQDFLDVFQGGKSVFFTKNLSLHCIFVGAESYSGDPKLLQIYPKHYEAILKMLEDGEMKPPTATIVGSFSVETVRKAHQMLEEGRVKGKLVMQVKT